MTHSNPRRPLFRDSLQLAPSVGPEVDFTCFADQLTTNAAEESPGTTPGVLAGEVHGTSFATPVVAGAAAMLLYVNPSLYNDDVYNLMAMSATLDDLEPDGFPIEDAFGHGLIKAGAAIDSLLMNVLVSGTETGSSRTVTQSLGTRQVRNTPYPIALPIGTYDVTRYLCEKDISFPASFVAQPHVWGRGVDTSGMHRVDTGGTRLSLDHKRHCEVKAGSIGPTGCTLVTYVYRLQQGETSLWYPAPPDSVTWGWAALGKDGVVGVADSSGDGAASVFVAPNPFNAQTLISFNNARAGNVVISICDIRGRKCAVLHNGMLLEGRHEFSWNGDDQDGKACASSVYLVRVEAPLGTVSKSIVLVK